MHLSFFQKKIVGGQTIIISRIGILYMLSKDHLNIISKKQILKKKINKKIITKGNLLFTGPMIDHAMYYTEETEILVVSKNPRDQNTYEEDTVRIDFMTNENRF